LPAFACRFDEKRDGQGCHFNKNAVKFKKIILDTILGAAPKRDEKTGICLKHALLFCQSCGCFLGAFCIEWGHERTPC
jgi:hypothetical protein